MENLSNKISCCYLINLLGKINKLFTESESSSEIIQLIYCVLDKEIKLCPKCN
ncbi:MAG: hypothetical protein mread185_000161 [Mycoplasmataceae bacterium]|nr:MAG: hypothetical protein mread185_000161 [Mycoplasmataceae bacterium]